MMYRFSKEKFMKNAPPGIKRQLSDRIDDLDGEEVIFDGRFGVDGAIMKRLDDSLEYYLYPIYRSWCVKEE